MEWLLENGYIDRPEDMLAMMNRNVERMNRSTRQRAGKVSLAGLRPNRRRDRTKKKRKVSAYQKEFGRQLKKLKRAHPRTPVTRLMKRAHAATRRARK